MGEVIDIKSREDCNNRRFNKTGASSMTTKQIKLKDYPELKLAHNFISKIPRSVIAGGVARDILLNGKLSEESDIDIFIGDTVFDMPTRLLDIFNVCNDLKIKPKIVV